MQGLRDRVQDHRQADERAALLGDAGAAAGDETLDNDNGQHEERSADNEGNFRVHLGSFLPNGNLQRQNRTETIIP